MKNKLKKNSFIEGAFVSYIAIIVTKIMGALYNIPFYKMIGDDGGFIYACAFTIYMLFLDISTSGIPTAISIMIGKYTALERYRSKEKTYRIGFALVVAISVVAFIMMQIFAPMLGDYFIGSAQDGVKASDITLAIRIVSLCLLIAPFLSVERGYLLGSKYIAISSISQVIEQVVRIVFVLVGSYIAIYVFHQSSIVAVSISLFGTALSAFIAYVYLIYKKRQLDISDEDPKKEKRSIHSSSILKQIVVYCFVIIILSVSTNLYSIIDMKFLLMGLHNLGFPDVDSQTIASIASTWALKITMIINALTMGIITSIIPYISDSYATNKIKEANNKINQALSIMFGVNLPITIGVIFFSEPVYHIFYGDSLYGGNILSFALLVNFIAGFVSIISMVVQSMNYGKQACFANILGIVINTALDLPMIYLFHSLEIPAYLGASMASIIGQIVTFAWLTYFLRKTIRLNAKATLNDIKRLILPLIAMTVVIVVFNSIWQVSGHSRIYQVLQLGICGTLGAGVYFILAYKVGAMEYLFQNNKIQKILTLLHVK